MRTLEFREKQLGTVVVVDGIEYYNREHVVAMISGALQSYGLEAPVTPSKPIKKVAKGKPNRHARKLSDEAVRRIRANKEKWNAATWARHYHLSEPVIWNVLNRRTYRDVV